MEFDDVDYFPSYEIITNPWSSKMFYESNLRSVREESINHVMQTFLQAHLSESHMEVIPTASVIAEKATASEEEDIVCEEVLLEAFSRNLGS